VPKITKISQAKTPEEFRGAVVERWRQIHRRSPRSAPPESPDEPPPPPRRGPADAYRGGRSGEGPLHRGGFGRGMFDDDE
jgi:hypothetical protein